MSMREDDEWEQEREACVDCLEPTVETDETGRCVECAIDTELDGPNTCPGCGNDLALLDEDECLGCFGLPG